MPTEPPDEEPEPSPEPTSALAAPKARQSLARVRRELSEEELASPAVQRLLIEELERLERQNVILAEYRERFHAADKEAAILKEQNKKSLAGEIVFGVALAVGAALVGYAPVLWSNQPSGSVALGLGIFLMIGGAVSRMVQR
jgi:hypothetical protein